MIQVRVKMGRERQSVTGKCMVSKNLNRIKILNSEVKQPEAAQWSMRNTIVAGYRLIRPTWGLLMCTQRTSHGCYCVLLP